MRSVFEKFDKDKDGKIDRQELRNGFQALGLDCSREQIFQIMKDMNSDDEIDALSFEEFSVAISKWSRVLLVCIMQINKQTAQKKKKKKNKCYCHYLSQFQHRQDTFHQMMELGQKQENVAKEEIEKEKAKETLANGKSSPKKKNEKHSASPLITDNTEDVKEEQHKDQTDNIVEKKKGEEEEEVANIDDVWKHIDGEEEEEDELELHLTDRQILVRALLWLTFGTALCIIFSDPMVEVIQNFSTTIGINPFF
ncbi:hypothetical protein RFI_11338, partial [Reticulomyxa filosa]